MNSSEFVFGWELQGRGDPTAKDITLGVIMFVFSFSLVVLGALNIYILRNMTIFHNAFGWFWLTRTYIEVVTNVVHVFYSAPVTIFQLRNIPPFMGLAAYAIAGGGNIVACFLHVAVCTNRFVAVYKPLQYQFIFSKANCIKIIIACIVPVPFGLALIFLIPCNMIGFSPVMYEYAFVSCEPNFYRNYSMVGSVMNKFCSSICILTASLQNVTMVITTVFIALSDQKYSVDDEVERILAFYMILLAHLGNSSTTTNASVSNVRSKKTTSHS
uniref:7TM_GPCR_Srx domain-containing protein n=1 Tax=Steinernema glaseri TaxID=37863 RepID=A0A1I8AL76_9BILA